ncbi:Putative zinc-binding metallo-peptidase [Chitinophaga jiangningensis]|uniref:Putative zinc-binding metallo-peptidase n=1 Tax=Chitinophaga jiangningensis TaxID=1419482 RepID=A0A1M7AEG2_9BACT|nr:putative zinc-binding metallopeptidase [Chitinophaga jiangningensis]SHL41183.1 Putative zinc-binding metallo-peptidase [Chitinophaga jiangningensis]
MKYKISLLWGLVTMMVVMAACSKEEALTAEVDPAPTFDTRTPLGQKQKEFFDKYGIQVEYKWNRYAYASDVVANPAKEEDVLPYLELLEIIYFKAMDAVGGASQTAVKETPVRLLLIGNGLNYGGAESFGESTAGQAGNIQPNRLTLGGLTPFGELLRAKNDTSDRDFLDAIYNAAPTSFPDDAGLIGFVWHEYTHFLDSKHQIPVGFELPAKTNYLRGSNQFLRVTYPEAISKGFFIPYGMQNEHEDFATYVQTIIWLSDAEINTYYLTNEATKAKYQLVTNYFTKLGIPITKLRDYLQQQSVINELIALKRKYEQ